MPPPFWNFAPQQRNGNFAPGFDRRDPTSNMYQDWTPGPSLPAAGYGAVSEVGGGMLRRPNMSGVGDFFTFPQGTNPGTFYSQQVRSGEMPTPTAGSPMAQALPEIHPETMDETALYNQTYSHSEGAMAWEGTPAPWDLPPIPGSPQTKALSPGAAPGAIMAMDQREHAASENKAIEAAQASKIAADNAARAAMVGAPKVAATHAATAQAAANVAARCCRTPRGHKAAAAAQAEATKAVAAANVAARNANPPQGRKQGMGDWLTLSGMGGFLDNPVAGGVQVKHILYGVGGAAVLFFGYRFVKSR